MTGVPTIRGREITADIAKPYKSVGDYEATVRLRDDLVAVISLRVVAAK